MYPIRMGGPLAACLLTALLLGTPAAFPQPKSPGEESDDVVPVAASVQALRNVEIPLGGGKMKVSSIEYAQQGATVYLLPVWVVTRVETFSTAGGRWEELPPGRPLPARAEATSPRLRVHLANLLAQEDSRAAIEQRLRDHVAKSEGVKPEQVKLRAPTFNPRGYRVALAAPGTGGDAGEVALSGTVTVPRAVAEDNGPVLLDLLPENIAGLQAANAEPVILRDTYLKLSGQMKARFEKQQYLANFQVVQSAVTALQNDLKSIQPTGQPAPEVLVQVPAGGTVEGKAAVTAAFSQHLVGSISVREGASVNPGLLTELAERVLARILSQVELAQAEDSRRAAVMLGNMATLSATVGEIKVLAKQTRAERENHLKTALDEMEARRSGERREFKGSVGVEFGARTLLGGVSGKVQAEAESRNATEEERANRRKQEVETLHRGLDELARHFAGRLPTLTGIRFDQKALDESLKLMQVELQQNSFTTGWSQHEWAGIKLATTAGLAVGPELLLRQAELAQARYTEIERLLGTPERVKELQELLRETRSATEQAKAVADRIAEREKGGTPAEVERRLKKLEMGIMGIPRTFLKGHTLYVRSAKFSPDGKTVATASFDNTARVWDVATGAELVSFKGHTGWVTSLAFSPDGKTVVTGSYDKTARLWDPATGAEKLVLNGHTAPVNAVSFSPDGRTVATGSFDKTARVWDAATGAELLVFKGHTGLVSSVAFSPDGKTLATSCVQKEDGAVRLWDPATGAEKLVLKGHAGPVSSVAFSPDGKTVATASHDKTAQLWDAATGAELLVFKGHPSLVYGVSFSPDGKTLATAGDRTARLWDVATGTERAVLRGHTSIVASVSFSPDGRMVATAGGTTRGGDTTVRLWDLYP